MEALEVLFQILQFSVAKHGEKPLTNTWLLHIVKLSLKTLEDRAKEDDILEAWYGQDSEIW